MNLKVGDRVSFINERRQGIVINILNNSVVSIMVEEGIEIPVHVSELLRISSETSKNKSESEKQETIMDTIKKEKLSTEELIKKIDQLKRKSFYNEKVKNEVLNISTGYLEFDLHIEELIDDYSGMNNAEIVNLQLSYFKQYLNEAIKKRVSKAIFIHGVGNGTLKREIRRELKNYKELKFQDANYGKYGFGATEVIF